MQSTLARITTHDDDDDDANSTDGPLILSRFQFS